MNDHHPTDDALVVAAKAGGQDGQRAFAALVSRYNGWLVGLLTSLLGRRAEAEDVAQEAFIRAFLAIGRFEVGQSVQAWLRVIATRLAYNRMRNAATRSRYVSAFGEQVEAETPPADRLASRELLSRTLSQLSYAHREIIVLHHVEELSLKAIAATLGVGLSAAKMRLSRARAEFVAHYNALLAEGEGDDPAADTDR